LSDAAKKGTGGWLILLAVFQLVPGPGIRFYGDSALAEHRKKLL
jgi:hypothetical protein